MNTEWQRFEGPLPRALLGLGDSPTHHNGHWWIKRDAGILRFATPGFGDAAAFQAAANALANQVAAPIQAADTYLSAGETANALQAYQAAGQVAVGTVGPQIDGCGAPNVTQPYTQFAWGLNGQLAAATDATAAQGLAHNILTTLQDAIRDGQNSLSAPAPVSNSDLLAAAQALKAYMDQNGVPPKTQKVALVGNFQQAYINAGNTLAYGVDQEYGPATAAALAAVLGSSPNPVPGPSPSPSPPGPGPSPNPTPNPSTTSSSSDYTVPILVGAGVVAVVIVGVAVYMHQKKRGGGKAAVKHHAHA